MSSYLNVYVKVKKEVDEKETLVHLWSFSRSSDIYQFFYDNNLSHYSGDGKPSKVNSELVDDALIELKDEIIKDRKRLALMKEFKGEETIEDILSWEEYIEEKETLENDVRMIMSIISKYAYNDVEGLYTYID